MTEYTITAVDPTEGLITVTVTAATPEAAEATLAEGVVVIMIATHTTL